MPESILPWQRERDKDPLPLVRGWSRDRCQWPWWRTDQSFRKRGQVTVQSWNSCIQYSFFFKNTCQRRVYPYYQAGGAQFLLHYIFFHAFRIPDDAPSEINDHYGLSITIVQALPVVSYRFPSFDNYTYDKNSPCENIDQLQTLFIMLRGYHSIRRHGRLSGGDIHRRLSGCRVDIAGWIEQGSAWWNSMPCNIQSGLENIINMYDRMCLYDS